ncbi:MAG: hypothetical protein AAGG01_07300 [Planctomycetota bacterium]
MSSLPNLRASRLAPVLLTIGLAHAQIDFASVVQPEGSPLNNGWIAALSSNGEQAFIFAGSSPGTSFPGTWNRATAEITMFSSPVVSIDWSRHSVAATKVEFDFGSGTAYWCPSGPTGACESMVSLSKDVVSLTETCISGDGTRAMAGYLDFGPASPDETSVLVRRDATGRAVLAQSADVVYTPKSLSDDGSRALVALSTLSSGGVRDLAIWTPTGGLVPMGADSAGYTAASPARMSGDGQVVVFENGLDELIRWTPSGGFVSLGVPTTPPFGRI